MQRFISRHRCKAVVVVGGDKNQPIIRINQAFWAARAAGAVEVGFAIGTAAAAGQRLAKIVKLVTADHMPRPSGAQAAATPAARLRFLLCGVTRWQPPAVSEVLHGVDKSP